MPIIDPYDIQARKKPKIVDPYDKGITTPVLEPLIPEVIPTTQGATAKPREINDPYLVDGIYDPYSPAPDNNLHISHLLESSG